MELFTIMEGTNAILTTKDLNRVEKFLFEALGYKAVDGILFRLKLRLNKVATFSNKERTINIACTHLY